MNVVVSYIVHRLVGETPGKVCLQAIPEAKAKCHTVQQEWGTTEGLLELG